MIKFKQISYKNFLSTGNQPNIIMLDRTPSALITGHNGAGKSTILDALCFGVFGKPYRNITKPQLLNTVNEKGAVVEVEFTQNNVDYRVVRGIKPNIFEIYQNDVLIPHDAAIKDYQKRLEDILGLNYKAFTQIVILGSARYQSFMDLSNGDRRTIIEEILDITVFSKMNAILKSKLQTCDLDLRENDYQKELIGTKITAQRSLIKNIVNRSKESAEKIESEKLRIGGERSLLEDKLKELDKEIENQPPQFDDLKDLHDKINSAKFKGRDMMNKEKELTKKIKFYSENDHCHTCEQTIADDIKADQINTLNDGIAKLDKIKPLMSETLEKLTTKIDTCNEMQEKLNKLIDTRRTYTGEIDSLDKILANLKVTTGESDEESLSEAQSDLDAFEEERRGNEKENVSLAELRHHYEVCKILLRDDGIKAKIIKQYLPIMNQLINKYLDKMGANYSFNLNEQFQEVIKSRYRDSFSYASFSEGEKMRIDLALMFTWREIAKIKNSINTNLLIMDEVGDSSLDAKATDVLWEILGDLEDSNVFDISHKATNGDKFRSLIEFEKVGNFSKIKDSKK